MRYKDAPRDDTVEIGDKFADFVRARCKEELGFDPGIFKDKERQFNVGESPRGWEYKYDEQCTQSHSMKLSIEVAEKSNRGVSQWTPSGIHRNDNTSYYAHGNFERIFVFKIDVIRGMQAGRQITEKNGTVRTFYLGLCQAGQIALYDWRTP